MELGNLQIGNKYFFVYGETDMTGQTHLTVVHEEIIGFRLEKSRVFAGQSCVLIQTPRHTLSCSNVIGETAREAMELYTKHVRDFTIPEVEKMELALEKEIYEERLEKESSDA